MKQISCLFLVIACSSALPTHRNGFNVRTLQNPDMFKATTYVPSESLHMYGYQQRPSVPVKQRILNSARYNSNQDREYEFEGEIGEMSVGNTFIKPQQRIKPPAKEVLEDDQQAGSPFNINRNGASNYNTFFPIVIRGAGGSSGGYGRISNDDGDQGYYPGAATAIANSFSTGKGGVAKSHATSYGDPYLAMYLKNLKRSKSV